MSGGRDRYADVGAAFRESIRRLLEEKTTPRRTRLILAAFHFTASYSRIGDRVYVEALADLARVDRRNTVREMKFLHELGALVWDPGKGGRHKGAWVALPHAAEKGWPLVATVSAEKGWPFPTRNDGHSRHERMAVGGHPTEMFRERPRKALSINTECMHCNELRACVDDGERILCDQCRSAA